MDTSADLFLAETVAVAPVVPLALDVPDGVLEFVPSLLFPHYFPQYYIRIVLGSFLGFSALFLFYCACCHCTKLRTRPPGFIMNLSGVLVSETQAIIAALAGLKIVVQTWSDVVFAKSSWTNPYSMVFCGYLLYDMIMTYITDVRIGKPFFAMIRSQFSIYCHHLAFLLVVPPVSLSLRDGKADHFIGCFLTMEFPVIFLHFQHVLSIFGMTGKKPYLINGILCMVTYFFFRIAIFPFMFYRLAVRKGVSFSQIHKSISRSCILGSIACFLMQIYWFVLICRKAFRVKQQIDKEKRA